MAKKISVGVEIDGKSKGFEAASKRAELALQRLRKKTDTISKGIVQAFKKIAIAAGAAFGVRQLVAFGKEAVAAGAKLQGIKKAFEGLGDPKLLASLREATRGTVDDLKLMTMAVRADNFKIPLEKLAGYFAFATSRAIETGESVDFLVESIVKGIGRKSALVFDNTGISVVELQLEIAKVGDFATAASNIIEKSMASMGTVLDTASTRMARLAASWSNFKTNLGERIVESNYFNNLLDGLDRLSGKLESKKVNKYGAYSRDNLEAEKARLLQAQRDYLIEKQIAEDKAKAEEQAAQRSMTIMTDVQQARTGMQTAIIGETTAVTNWEEKLNKLSDALQQLAEQEEVLNYMDEAAEKEKKLAEEAARAAAEVARLAAAEKELFNQEIIMKREDEATKLAKQKAQDAQQRLEEAQQIIMDREDAATIADSVDIEGAMQFVDGLTNAFAAFFQQTEGGFDEMAKSFGRAILQMAAQFAAKALMWAILMALMPGAGAIGTFAKGITSAGFGAFMGLASPGGQGVTSNVGGVDGMMSNNGAGQTINVQGIIAGRDLAIVTRRNL